MNNKKGFTLIELVISFAILLIVIVPLMNLLMVSAKTSVASKDELESAIDLQCLLEEIKASDDLLNLVLDGRAHEYALDSSISYEIHPVTEYDTGGKHTLYYIHLVKTINGAVLQDFTGTKLIE
jgi:prepilin-type N-terminal cleavage/methylation domain-containing protein